MLRSLVENLSYSVNMVANRRASLFAVVQQVDGIKQLQIVDFAQDGQNLIVIDMVANNRQIDVRTFTIVSFRPWAENQNLLDVRMPPKHILQFLDNRIAKPELHACV